MFLNEGDEVPLNDVQAKQLPKEMVRVEAGPTFIDHTIVLGRRQAIAGVEHALMGMKGGGYRTIRISPHLGYRDKGIPGLILSNAVLIAKSGCTRLRVCPRSSDCREFHDPSHPSPCPSSPNCVSTQAQDEGHPTTPFRQ
jgi:hypothetical protein